MSLENEEQWNKKIFLDCMEFFPAELKKWCDRRGLDANIPTDWPIEGSIGITRGAMKLEIKMLNPDGCDSFMKLNRVWGLVIEENMMGSKAFIARWPGSWRSLDQRKPSWNEIDFGEYMERQLSEYFGVEMRPVPLPEVSGGLNA